MWGIYNETDRESNLYSYITYILPTIACLHTKAKCLTTYSAQAWEPSKHNFRAYSIQGATKVVVLLSWTWAKCLWASTDKPSHSLVRGELVNFEHSCEIKHYRTPLKCKFKEVDLAMTCSSGSQNGCHTLTLWLFLLEAISSENILGSSRTICVCSLCTWPQPDAWVSRLFV